MIFRLIGIGLTLLLAGCGPRYIIKNEYIPPANANAASCLNQCSFMRQNCQDQCQRQYQYCLDDAYAKAKAVEVDEQRNFDLAYGRYQMDLMRYQMEYQRWQHDYYDYSRDFDHFQSQCERNKDPYACQRRDELRRYLSRLNHQRPREPWIPSRPSFEQILSRQQSLCVNDCGCDQTYDTCFVGCGGQVIPHKICVDNCDNQ